MIMANKNQQNLAAKCRKTRSAAAGECHTEAEQQHAARIAELQGLLGAAHDGLAKRKAEIDRTNFETMRALERELIQDAYSKLGPIVGSWIQEPTRALTSALASQMQAFITREDFELGATGYGHRVIRALGFLFIDEALKSYPRALTRFAGGLGTGTAEVAMACNATLEALASTAAFSGALERLERAVFTEAARPASEPDAFAIQRYRVARSCSPYAEIEFNQWDRQGRPTPPPATIAHLVAA